MAGPEFGGGPPFPGSFGLGRLGDSIEGRGPPHGSSFPPGPDSWSSAERGRDPGWDGGPGENSWGSRDGPRMPPGNIVSGGFPGRGPSMFSEGRGRGFGRGLDFVPRGRGTPGRFGRGGRWGESEFEGARSWGGSDAPMPEDWPGPGVRPGFRGRGEFGRGRFGRFGGRFSGGGGPGFEGHGRREAYPEDGPKEADIDTTLLDRRRASTAALLRRQVSQLQVSKSLLGDVEAAEVYGRILEAESDSTPQADVRSLYTYPMFAAEEIGTVPNSMPTAEETSAAFEQCLHKYQDAQQGHTVVQSEHGNFMMPLQLQ